MFDARACHSRRELAARWKKVGCWNRGDGYLALKSFGPSFPGTNRSQRSVVPPGLLGEPLSP